MRRTDLEGRSIRVPLAPGVLVEALILKRLSALPKRRHPDWIRALLIQGFLAESRVVRQLERTATEDPTSQRRVKQATPSSGFTFADGFGGFSNAKPVAGVNGGWRREDVPVPTERSAADKPFAHLRKVIG